ncbi:hypothetical protein MesoLjLc_29160 [Mesorhizobium sp. L-8-10]|uniref:TIGR02466 family protein n=1 Tax=unclassified Mesorhizobium TaxID=325217 RepID=UPI0019263073|nr:MULTISPECIES: TIGR02466 family protein [unclassified Mesorhizobium]BCH23178.1 hypothetical protein MesoLjLb_29630 [Mesorhizobium sp. L-8-3]BCH30986.1 hypothetical protein MesoLjLc_29160 [Mesorhizobium sp. L-8-10]
MNANVSLVRTNYFPTMVFQHDIGNHGDLNNSLLTSIYNERERDRSGVNKSNTPQLGSWHSHTGLHKSPAYAELLTHVNSVTSLMSRELGYANDYTLKVTTMWSIINPPGNGNRAHIHPGCIWSGVYYVQAPEGAGEIEFVDPRTALLMNQPKYIAKKKRPRDCWTKVNYKPMAGRMLIFPSWLYHGVDPNMAKESGQKADRVIMSFNISQVKRAEA